MFFLRGLLTRSHEYSDLHPSLYIGLRTQTGKDRVEDTVPRWIGLGKTVTRPDKWFLAFKDERQCDTLQENGLTPRAVWECDRS